MKEYFILMVAYYCGWFLKSRSWVCCCVSAGETASGGGEETADGSQRSAKACLSCRGGQTQTMKLTNSIEPLNMSLYICVGLFTQASLQHASAVGRQTVWDRKNRIPLQEEWRVTTWIQTPLLISNVSDGTKTTCLSVSGWGKCGRRENVQFTAVTWPLHMLLWVFSNVCMFRNSKLCQDKISSKASI